MSRLFELPNTARLEAFERVVNAVWRQVKRGGSLAECQSAAEACVGVAAWLRPEELAETVHDTFRTARRQQRQQGQ